MIQTLLKIISWISLVVLLAPSVFFLMGLINLGNTKIIMIFSTIVWFVTALLLSYIEKIKQKT